MGIRNKEVHGNDDKEIEEIKKRRVVQELQQYFALSRNVDCVTVLYSQKIQPHSLKRTTLKISQIGY